MSWTFNPPPGWPVPPGFVPPQGWVPDPAWPPAPADWTYWVETAPAASEQAIPAPSAVPSVEDPFRVPPPGTVPLAAAWGAPAGYPPAGGYPPPPNAYGGYGGYGAPAYGTAPYGAPAYGAAPPRRGMSGVVIGVIVAVVVLLIVGLVVGAIAIGRGIGNVVTPFITSVSACEDAVIAVEDDGIPPTRDQARSALPDLRDARDRAAESVDSSSVVSPNEVLRPIEEVIAGYEVFADLPANPATWSSTQRDAADSAESRIADGSDDLDAFCGYDEGSAEGDVQTIAR